VSVPEALKGIDWRGRILIDATNAHMDPKPDISLEGVTRSRAALKGRTSSEIVAEMAVGTRLVKSINNMPMAWIQDFSPNKSRTVIFTSGDDAEAKKIVMDMVNRIGFVAIDLGSLVKGGCNVWSRRSTIRHRIPLRASASLRVPEHGLTTWQPQQRAAGLAFLPYCEDAFFSAGSGNEIRRQLSLLQGEDGVRFSIEAQGHMMDSVLSSLPEALATARADAVVLDTYQYYVELIPISLGLPYVYISNALHFDYSGYTPLCLYDWPHETTQQRWPGTERE
jgi:hypothetical protein